MKSSSGSNKVTVSGRSIYRELSRAPRPGRAVAGAASAIS